MNEYNEYHVTHTHPDLDAGLSSWLLLRFVYGVQGTHDLPVKFVNTGNPNEEILNNAYSVSDTGKVFDPQKLRFDHHQFSGRNASDTSAAEQVFEFVNNSGAFDYLAPLVELVTLGDAGKAPKSSYEYGLHALLSGFRLSVKDKEGRSASDIESLEFMFGVLDDLNFLYERNLVRYELDFRAGDYADLIAINQAHRQKIQTELDQLVKWRSDDSMVVAVENGSSAHSFTLYEQGCVLSVFKNTEGIEVKTTSSLAETDFGVTYPVGVARNPEWTNPHVGELLNRIEENHDSQETAEIREWFRHNAGFFAGSGTAKAPVLRDRPPDFDVVELAKLVDEFWKR